MQSHPVCEFQACHACCVNITHVVVLYVFVFSGSSVTPPPAGLRRDPCVGDVSLQVGAAATATADAIQNYAQKQTVGPASTEHAKISPTFKRG